MTCPTCGGVELDELRLRFASLELEFLALRDSVRGHLERIDQLEEMNRNQGAQLAQLRVLPADVGEHVEELRRDNARLREENANLLETQRRWIIDRDQAREGERVADAENRRLRALHGKGPGASGRLTVSCAVGATEAWNDSREAWDEGEMCRRRELDSPHGRRTGDAEHARAPIEAIAAHLNRPLRLLEAA